MRVTSVSFHNSCLCDLRSLDAASVLGRSSTFAYSRYFPWVDTFYQLKYFKKIRPEFSKSDLSEYNVFYFCASSALSMHSITRFIFPCMIAGFLHLWWVKDETTFLRHSNNTGMNITIFISVQQQALLFYDNFCPNVIFQYVTNLKTSYTIFLIAVVCW